jgi:hypothetical protein
MNDYSKIAITLVIAVLTVVANAVVSTTVRHSESKEAAFRALKQTGNRILRRILAVVAVAWVIYNVSAPGPVSGSRVFVIAAGVGMAVYVLLMLQLIRVADTIGHAIETAFDQTLKVAKIQGDHIRSTREVVEVLRAGQTGGTEEQGGPKH